MKVSVVIPCYNGELFIRQCIEAVLSQTHIPDEVIVIDDGSIDSSAELALKYPIQLIQHKENKGLSQARNTALVKTVSDIIIYIDVDAYAHPKLVEILLSFFSDASIAGVGGQGIEVVQENIYDGWRRLHATQGYGPMVREGCQYLFGLCMAYRRQVLLEVGGFDTRLRTNAEDMDIGFRLTAHGYKLVYTPDAQVFHQRHDNRDSLRQMMYQWYYWAFIIKNKNGRQPWTLALGTLHRLLFSDFWRDMLTHHSLKLAGLNLEIFSVKMNAIISAARSDHLQLFKKSDETQFL